MKKRILSWIFVFCILFSSVPLPALDVGAQESAAQANTQISMQTASVDAGNTLLLATTGMAKGQKADAWSGSYVYFGEYNGSPIRFRVLRTSTTDFSDDGVSSTMLLDCDTLLFSSKFDDNSSNWKDSWLRSYLNGSFLADSFSADERKAIAHSVKNAPTEEEAQVENLAIFAPLDDDVFLLDVREILTEVNGYYGYFMLLRKNSDNDIWWLRSKGSNFDNVTYWPEIVNPSRALVFGRKVDTGTEYGVSPALNLKLSSILFSNLVSGELGQSGAEYALTIINEDRFSGGLQRGKAVERDGNRLSIPFNTKTDGSNASLKLMFLDKPYEDGNANGAKILLNETLTSAVNGAKAYVDYDLPAEFSSLVCGKDYYAYLYVEQDRVDEKETMYASRPHEVTIPALTRTANLGTRALFVSPDGWTSESGTWVRFGTYGDNKDPGIFRVLPSSPETQQVAENSLMLESFLPFTSMKYHDSSANWNDSDVKRWLEENWESFFSETERGAILPTTLLEKSPYDIAADRGTLKFYDYASENNKLFLLSAAETDGLYVNPNDRLKNVSYWFLRSALAEESGKVGVVSGTYGTFISDNITTSYGVVPALNLDASKIMLTTANILLDKSQPLTTDSTILETVVNTEWRLTLLDERKSVQVTDGLFAGADNGKIYVPYSYWDSTSSVAEQVNQISVMITDYPYADSKAQVLYYGALQDITDKNGNPADISTAKTGVGSFFLPDELVGKKLGTDYHVYLIAEHTENNDKTDIASAPAEVPWICSTGGFGSYTLPTEKGCITYKQAFQDLINYATVTSGAEFRYSFDGEAWSDRALAVDSGDYSVRWKLIDSTTGEDLYVWPESIDARISLLTVANVGGGVSHHLNLPDAMASAQDGAVIKLYGDVIDDTFGLNYKFSGDRNVTIDLNGQLLRCKRTITSTMTGLTFTGDGVVDTPVDFDGGSFYCEGGIFLKQVTLYKKTVGARLNGGYFSRLAATTITLRDILADGYEFFRDGRVYNFSQRNVAEEVLVAPNTSDAEVSVTYAPNGGTGDMDVCVMQLGKTFAVSECRFVRDGYIFSGWNTEANGSGKSYAPGMTTIIDHSITLYAQWVEKTEYIVTFDANGGEGQMEPQLFYFSVPQKLNENIFTKRRYIFTGWNTSPSGGGASVSDGQLLIMDCDITLYAQWTADPNPTYYVTVQCIGGGTAYASRTGGTRGTEVTLTAKPDENWYLKEWKVVSGDIRIKADGTFRFSRDDVVIQAVFAEVPENQSLIRFDSNGGSGIMKEQLVEKGKNFTLTDNTFTNAEMIFDGWNTEKDGSGIRYTDSQMLSTYKNLTLYAQWRNAYTFTISFHSNGGTGTMEAQNVTEGEKAVLNANTFVRDGYTFEGWNTMPDGSGTDYADGETVDVLKDTVLYAVWFNNAVKRYSVTVSANYDGVSVSADTALGTAGTLVHLTAEETVIINNRNQVNFLQFSYWEVVSGDVEIINDSFVIVTSDVYIRAIYTDMMGGGSTPQMCQITYNSNFGINPEEHSYTISPHGITVDNCQYTNLGYNFTGWNTKADGSGMTVLPGQEIKFHDKLTLYAQWGCEEHFGVREATCTERAACSKCGKSYGELNPNNHTGQLSGWKNSTEMHWKVYSCCDAKVKLENHTYTDATDATCNICGYVRMLPFYTVSFSTNGGSIIADRTDVKWADKVLDEVPVPTRAGFDFVGWKCGNVVVNAETIYADLAKNYTVTSVILVAQWKDMEAPTGEIRIGTNRWSEFLGNLTFGLFFKDTQEVNITASDNSGAAVTTAYLLSDKELTGAELATMTFTPYIVPFSISPDNEYVIYVRLTDTSGNVAYVNTNGIVLDATAPDISGIENGKIYCTERTVAVTEKFIKSVTVNNTEIVRDGNGQFVLLPAEGEQTVVVTDRSGNSTSVTVTVNDGHTAEADDGDCTTAVNCEVCGQGIIMSKSAHSWGSWVQKSGRDTHIHKCQNTDCTISETESCTGGTATCTEKAKCDFCGEKYGELDTGNHSDLKHFPAKTATRTMTSEGNIEYWYCSSCDKYFSDAAATKEITKADIVVTKQPDDSKFSQTGDNYNLALWIAMLLASGGAGVITIVYCRKRKHREN